MAQTTVLLGKETGGEYAGLFNLPGGKKEGDETKWQTAQREALEEIRILFEKPGEKESFMVRHSEVFIVTCPFGLRRSRFRRTKEMSEIEFFDLEDLRRVAAAEKGRIDHKKIYKVLTVDGVRREVSAYVIKAVKTAENLGMFF